MHNSKMVVQNGSVKTRNCKISFRNSFMNIDSSDFYKENNEKIFDNVKINVFDLDKQIVHVSLMKDSLTNEDFNEGDNSSSGSKDCMNICNGLRNNCVDNFKIFQKEKKCNFWIDENCEESCQEGNLCSQCLFYYDYCIKAKINENICEKTLKNPCLERCPSGINEDN